jgi:hypothetical protein
MSQSAQFFLLLALDVAGLFVIWFALKARIRRYLELENLLSGVRDEARALILELNETADRNVSLVEDRIVALRELLGEVDRRIGVEKREMATREAEREVYSKLNRRRPIVPQSDEAAAFAQVGAKLATPAAPATIDVPAAPSEEKASPPAAAQSEGLFPPELPRSPRPIPQVRLAEEPIATTKTMREQALELYRSGFSADIIATRLGATVAEMELLIEMEERRAGLGSSGGYKTGSGEAGDVPMNKGRGI